MASSTGLVLRSPFLGKMGLVTSDQGRLALEVSRFPPLAGPSPRYMKGPVSQALLRQNNSHPVGPSHSDLSPKLPSLSHDASSQPVGPVATSATASPVLERPSEERSVSEQSTSTAPSSIAFLEDTMAKARTTRTLHHIIDNVDNLLVDDQNLPSDHPGAPDAEYVQRRRDLAAIAKNHKFGRPIPRISYSDNEIYVWRTVLEQLRQLHPTHASSKYNNAVKKLDFRLDAIPQLEDVSKIMYEHTGWRIRPVAGLMDPRDFIGGMAFKIFHCTQYVRHHSQPMYSPEPDLCHELIGHAPMFLDPEFSDMVQAIGRASLGATNEEFVQLTRLFWYTCEFGVIEEEGEMKAFGAGLLSSFGELAYMRSGHEGVFPRFRALGDPTQPLPPMRHKPGFQTRYMVSDGFADIASKLSTFAAHLDRK